MKTIKSVSNLDYSILKFKTGMKFSKHGDSFYLYADPDGNEILTGRNTAVHVLNGDYKQARDDIILNYVEFDQLGARVLHVDDDGVEWSIPCRMSDHTTKLVEFV